MDENFRRDAFGPEDRKALIELGVHMRNMKDSVDKIEHKLGDEGSVNARFAILTTRIEDLERFKYWILGAAVAGGGSAGAIVQKLFGGH